MTVKCKQETIVYARCVGYFAPVAHFNKGKQEEYGQRVNFDVAGIKGGAK